MTDDIIHDHERIWLQPACAPCTEDRLWCQDDVWGRCEECGTPSVEYVRADLAGEAVDARRQDVAPVPAEVREVLANLYRVCDRLTTAIDCAAEDVGCGFSVNDVLKDLGPATNAAGQILTRLDAAAASEPLPPAPGPAEYDLMGDILAELERARAKFPGDNVTALALVEEVGEVAKAIFSEPAARVRAEAVQVACMAMRVVLDGDATVRDWRAAQGLDSLDAAAGGEGDHN